MRFRRFYFLFLSQGRSSFVSSDTLFFVACLTEYNVQISDIVTLIRAEETINFRCYRMTPTCQCLTSTSIARQHKRCCPITRSRLRLLISIHNLRRGSPTRASTYLDRIKAAEVWASLYKISLYNEEAFAHSW